MKREIGAESGRLEIDVHPASSFIDQGDFQTINRQLSIVTVPSDVQYLAKLSTALIPQLQFWHLCWLASVQFSMNLQSQVS